MKLARGALIATLSMAIVAGSALTDPAPISGPSFVHLHSPRMACLVPSDPTSCVQLAEGFFLDEPTYGKLDAEVKRLQDAETRLIAENTSLRASASSWQPGWLTLTVAFVAGASLAVYVDHKFQ